MIALAVSADTSWTAATYAGLGLAALLVGFVKTGLPPLGVLVPVVMALTFPTRESVGALVIFLVIGDAMAVAYYWRNADWSELTRLIPPVAGGMILGALILGVLDDRLLRVVIGALVLGLVLLELIRLWCRIDLASDRPAFRIGVGAAAGLATTLANAAGPIMGVYFLSSGLGKARFMGTTAVFFLVVNASKIPVYASLEMIRAPYLQAFAALSPLVIVGAWIGKRFFAWIPQRVFHFAVLALTATASALLLTF